MSSTRAIIKSARSLGIFVISRPVSSTNNLPVPVLGLSASSVLWLFHGFCKTGKGPERERKEFEELASSHGAAHRTIIWKIIHVHA